MLGAGIKTTADIEITLNLNKTKAWNDMKASVKELKASLNDLAKTVGIEQGVKNYSALERELKKVQSELEKTKGDLKQQEDASKDAANGLSKYINVMDSAGNVIRQVERESDQMFQVQKEVTSHFGQSGKVIASFAANVDEAGDEIKGMRQAMDLMSEETKEDIQLEKQYIALMEGLQKQSSEAALAEKKLKEERLAGGVAIKLGAYQEEHILEFRKLQNQASKDLAKTLNVEADAHVTAFKARQQETKALEANYDLHVQEFRFRQNALKEQNAEIAAKQRLVTIADNERKARMKAAEAAFKATEQEKRAREADMARANSLKTLIGRINFYEKAMDAVFRASFRLKMAGTDLTFMGRRVIDSVKGMMDAYGDFEFMLNRAAGALSVPNEMIPELETKILDLSTAMRLFPAEEVAQALYFWGSTTGQVIDSTEKMTSVMSALDPVMKAAAMTNTNYEDTIKGVYSILAQYYNGAVSKTKEVTEQLFMVTQKTAAEFPDLINSFKMVGPIAKANNVTFGEMVDLFGRLADLGVRGSMAGRAFRQLFIQMLRPSGPAMKAIENMFEAARTSVKEFGGKSYFELMFPKGQFVGVEGYLRNLALATRSLTSADRNSFLAKIATANELPVLTALVNDQIRALKGLTAEQDKNTSSSVEATKYFNDNWEKLKNSWRGVTGALSATFEALKLQVASVMSEVLTPLANRATEVVNAIRDWAKDPANKELVAFLGKLVIVGGLAATAVGALLTMTGTLLGLSAAILIAVKSFARFIPLIGGIITVVVTLADAFIRNFDSIKESVDYAARVITDAMNQSGASMEDFGDVINSITEPIRGFMDIVIKGMNQLIRSSADMIATLSRMGALMPILKAFAAVMAAVFAAKAVGMVISMSRAIVVFIARATGIARVTKALTTMESATTSFTGKIGKLASAIGPGGIATLIMGAGFLAYDTNFFGFADGIDRFTNSFRDLKKEIKEVSDEFGNSSGAIQKVTKQMADSWAVMTDVTSFTAKPFDQNADPWTLMTKDWMSTNSLDNYSHVTATMADGSTGVFTDMAMAMRANETLANEKMIEIMKDWAVAVNDVNTQISTIMVGGPQFTTEDFGQAVQRLAPAFLDENGQLPISARDALRDTAKQVLLQQALTGSDVKGMTALYDKLTKDGATAVSEIQRLGLEGFLKMVEFENKTAAQKIMDNKQAARDAVFAPYAKALDAAIGAGATEDAVVAMLMKPTKMNINGENIDMPALSEVSGTLGEEVQRYIDGGLEYIGKTSADDLTATQSWEDILKEQWAPIADEISIATNKGMSSVMSDSMMLIGDDLQEIATQLPYANQGAAKGIGSTFNEMIQKLLDNGAIIPDFAKDMIRNIADYLRTRGGIDSTAYGEMEKAFKIGFVETTEAVEKTWEESVADFAANLDLRKGFAKAFKETKKLGSNAKQMAKVLHQFVRGDLKKALRGNLQSQALGKELMQNSIDAVMGGLEATKGGEQQNLALKVGRWVVNNWKNMPASAKVKWQPVLSWLLSGTVKLPPRLVEKLTGKVNTEVDTAIADVVAAVSQKSGNNTPIGERIGQELEQGPWSRKGKGATSDVGGITFDVKLAPNVTMSEVPQETMDTLVAKSIQAPMQISVDGMTVTADSAGKRTANSFGQGFNGNTTTVTTDYITPAVTTLIANMHTTELLNSSTRAGVLIGNEFGKGVGYGASNWASGGLKDSSPSSVINSIKNALDQKTSMYNGAYPVGASWAKGFKAGLVNNVQGTLVSISAWLVGNSPPPEGPLKNIDKGGFNIGHAWAEGITTGAEKEMHRGMKRVRSQMNSKEISGNMGVETTINRKKQIDININVNGSGKVDRETQSAMRKAVYDSLVDSEILDHMVTIN